MYPPILGDVGASSRDDAIFSGEKLQQAARAGNIRPKNVARLEISHRLDQ